MDYRWNRRRAQYNAFVLNFGKLLTEPLLVFLVVGFVCWIQLFRHPSRGRRPKRALTVLGLALLLLTILAMPLTGALLERSLLLTPDAEAPPPEVIVVLSGGYSDHGRYISADTVERVIAAVRWWKLHPSARMIMSGEAPPDSGLSRMTGHMARLAEGLGVPPSRIRTETRSRNTMEHPIEIARLPGITPDTRIGLVSSVWHLRRARGEFRRHFHHVSISPLAESASPIRWTDLIPQTSGLMMSTDMIHEWIGMVWYGLRHVLHLDSQRS